jgi:hypothetical protein
MALNWKINYWQKQSNVKLDDAIKEGDLVEVMKSDETWEDGWCDEMEESIGHKYLVSDVEHDSKTGKIEKVIIYLPEAEEYYSYPLWVLRKVHK